MEYFTLTDVTKLFGKRVALDGISVAAAEPSIIGLVGKNGSGKTTLLRHIVGLYLPTSGTCSTLGCATADLGAAELARIGMAHQHDRLVDWMSGEKLLRYVATFHDRWDSELERTLVSLLEIDTRERVGVMSPGNRQKLSLVLATCHNPSLLLLDEPMADLDPIVRRQVVETMLDRFRRDDMTIVISSHLLHDIERVVDRIVCLHEGKIRADAPLDDLKDRYAEWIVTSGAGLLPDRFAETYVVAHHGDRHRARLTVAGAAGRMREIESRYAAQVEVRPLNLAGIFEVLVAGTANGHSPGATSPKAAARDAEGSR